MKQNEPSPRDMIFIGADDVTKISRWLADLADAFERTGNWVVAKELAQTAENLTKAAEMIRQGAAQQINQRLRQSTESSTNIVLAALTGIEASSRLAASADTDEAAVCPTCGPSGNPALCLSVACPMRPEQEWRSQ